MKILQFSDKAVIKKLIIKIFQNIDSETQPIELLRAQMTTRESN